MTKIGIIIISSVALFVLALYKLDVFNNESQYVLSENEKEIIEYFKEIAVNTEFDDNPERVLKWKKPMFLFIHSEREINEQTDVVLNTIEKINQLFSDGFYIELVDKLESSNAVIYLNKKESIKTIEPEFYKMINDELLGEFTGMTYVEFKFSNFVIQKAQIFIDITENMETQTNTIIEELTQSIGLLNDSNKYSNSIFYENIDEIENSEYSSMDEEIIKLLYSKEMKPGFREKTVEVVIKNEFRNRAKKN